MGLIEVTGMGGRWQVAAEVGTKLSTDASKYREAEPTAALKDEPTTVPRSFTGVRVP